VLVLHGCHVVSVNIGAVRQVLWNNRGITTGIFKEPVGGRVRIRKPGVEGDTQADLSVHGELEKAVYGYPSEHYEYWKTELRTSSLPRGMFGENLTTHGLLEESVHIGDVFRVGSANLLVTGPRFPCYKLGIKFGTMEMVSRFQASGRSGFYFSVLKEGEVEAGDRIELIHSEMANPRISEAFMSQAGES
jgi:MOSC domain-containing protein YiiM